MAAMQGTKLSKSSTLTKSVGDEPAPALGNVQLLIGKSLSFPGSNQARKGRVVDALAVRGDEGRDNLR